VSEPPYRHNDPLPYVPPIAPPIAPPGTMVLPPDAIGPPIRRRGMPGWLIAVLAGAGALILLLAVAAVTVPTALAARERRLAANTRLVLPADIGAMHRRTDAATADVRAAWRETVGTLPLLRNADGALYSSGEGDVQMVVLTAHSRRALSPSERTRVLDGAATELSKQTDGARLDQVAAGRLGGEMRCGPTQVDSVRTEICAAVDAGAVFSVAVAGEMPEDQAVTLMRHAREAVEHR
jgi:hypothetical protein